MKQKPTFKSLLVVASIVSFFAFLAVNVHSGISGFGSALPKPGLVQSSIDHDEDEDRELSVPDITILGRLWEIAQKFIDRKH